MKLGMFVGRVGGDAELTYTSQGIAVAKFSIAIDNGKDKEGVKKSATWIRCAIWRERGEKLAPHIKKGNIVAVTGDIEARAWIDKQSGDARCALEVNVDKFTFVGSSRSNDNGGNSEPAQESTTYRQPAPAAPGSPITDEDISF